MKKNRFTGVFNWYGAHAIPSEVDKEGKMWTHAHTRDEATTQFVSRIATHLDVTLSKVINYYENHPNGFKVKEVD